MRRGDQPAPAQAFDHVAEVGDERVLNRGDVDPPVAVGRGKLDLESTRVVLGEEGEEPVVGVLTHAPCPVVADSVGVEADHGAIDRRVVEDPEQHGRIAAPPGDRVGTQPESQPQAA